jgi:putative peptidoglycan lipid II flippase
MSQMLKSSGAMGFATLTSRLLGLVREQVYAHFMGDTPVSSAFKLAFQVPNLFRRLLGEGALTAAFIPLFKAKERTEGEPEMWRAANAVICGLVLALAALTALVVLGITLFLFVSTIPFTRDSAAVFPAFPIPILSDNTRLMLELVRWMFPYVLLVCLAAVCMGMLNARGHFFIPALGATMLNVVMILTVLFLAPRFGATLDRQVFALAIGVLLAGIVQFTFQLPPLWRQGFRFQWVKPWNNETVREVVRKMVPGTIGVAAFQLNVLLIQGIAFWLEPTIVASFDYAVRLMEFPQGVVGISLATYLLPTLAGLAAEKRYTDFNATLREGLGHLLFINLIAAALLLALAEPIVRLLFERGAFTGVSTHRTAYALTCLAPSLVAYSVVNVLARAFYALGDTQTPMKISLVCLGLNLFFALWLIGPFRQGGLGLANTLSSIVNAWLLLHGLHRKLRRLDLTSLRPTLAAMLGAMLVAGVAAWASHRWWEARLGHTTLLLKLGAVFVPMTAAGLIYWGLSLGLRVPQARELGRLLLRRGRGEPEDSAQN